MSVNIKQSAGSQVSTTSKPINERRQELINDCLRLTASEAPAMLYKPRDHLSKSVL
jgi:hypothetical protein